MKYCKDCNVNVNHNLTNCPLCGSYLDEKNDNDNCAVYVGMDEQVSLPTVNIRQKVNFLQTKINKILMSAIILCVVLNMIITPESTWSAYVIMGGMIAIFCVLAPIAEKAKLQSQIKTDILVLTIVAFGMELTVTRLHFQWFVLVNVLPWLYVAAILLVDALIIFRRYEDKGLFATLTYVTFWALLPQITLWIASGFGIVLPDTHTVIIFFAALLNLAIVLIVCTRSLKEEMERNFNF